MDGVDLGELLAGLEPLQRRVVALVYFEGRTVADTAQVLTIERTAVGAALAAASRGVARWALTPLHDEPIAGPAPWVA